MTEIRDTALGSAEIAESDAPALSVIVVNYNAGRLLTDCVRAVLDSADPIQVLVSDNGSSDRSLTELIAQVGHDRRLSIEENGTNLGFAAANNRVLALATAPYLLFLNPDCVVGADTLDKALAFMDAMPGAGMAGCVIRNPDGTEQKGSRRAIPNPYIGLLSALHIDRVWPWLASRHRLDRLDQPLPDVPVRVDAISGAFMLVRRTALDSVGTLDEGYFLHCEDLDWFVRFSRAGWGIYLIPDAEVIHHKGACSAAEPVRVAWHKHHGMARFFRKFQFREYSLPVSIIVLLGIWAHFVVWMLISGLWRMLGALRAHADRS